MALCQFLPGPASSQVGIAIGLVRAGLLPGLAAWLGFTLPSALLVAFAYGLGAFGDAAGSSLDPWPENRGCRGGRARRAAEWRASLAPDRNRATLAVVAACARAGFCPRQSGQVGAIILGAAVWLSVSLCADGAASEKAHSLPLVCRTRGRCLRRFSFFFFALLIGLPLLASVDGKARPFVLVDAFYRTGSLVFGGGHVVLPFAPGPGRPERLGDVNDVFLAGYGAAQAVPGPLFTFAAYLGVVMGAMAQRGLRRSSLLSPLPFSFPPSSWWSASCRSGIICGGEPGPQAALKGGERHRRRHPARGALQSRGGPAAIHKPVDFALALTDFLLLFMWKTPPWLVVLVSAAGGAVLSL